MGCKDEGTRVDMDRQRRVRSERSEAIQGKRMVGSRRGDQGLPDDLWISMIGLGLREISSKRGGRFGGGKAKDDVEDQGGSGRSE